LKRSVIFWVLLFFSIAKVFAQYPQVTIRQIQEVSIDSLRLLDSLQGTQLSRWTLQASPYYRDTVIVTGVCVVPAKVLTYTALGFNLLIADTGSPSIWGGLFVRPNISAADTIIAIQWGILNVGPGDVVRFGGYVDEFPSASVFSSTQIVPLFSIPLQIIGSVPIPPPVLRRISDFYSSAYPGGRVRFSTGEPYESMRVLLRNALVHSYLNVTNCTFNMIDSSGSMMSTYNTHPPGPWGPPIGGCTLPPIGARVDSIRGFILTTSGSEMSQGYCIGPIYDGDVVLAVPALRLTTARRSPIVVLPDSAVNVTVRAFKVQGGRDIDSVKLCYGTTKRPLVEVPMAYTPFDSTARAVIPSQPANSFVRYFFKALDSLHTASILSSYSSSAHDDTSYGFFFYSVLNRPIAIRDIQYTPFRNGYSPYAMEYPYGAVVTISGIVTADTNDIRLNPRSLVGGTFGWYMQSGNAPWSGIWIVGPESTLAVVRRGDSISVTGIVQEWQNFQQNTTTRITNVQYPVTIHSSNNAVPSPVNLTTGTFGPRVANGDPNAEPYEGMLVRFNNVQVTNIYPYFSDPTQYEIDDGSGGVWVHRDGTNTFTNVPADSVDPTWTVLREGNRISYVIGVIHFSANRYKFVPRSNSDFGTVTGIGETPGKFVPKTFALAQNYPNPFNPSTTISYQLPTQGHVTLKVYDVLGREVATLVSGELRAGEQEVTFDGHGLATGVYFYRLQAGNLAQTKRLVLLR